MKPDGLTPPDDAVDLLVRAYLNRQAEQIDPIPALDRIGQTLADRSKRATRRRLAIRGGLAAVAALLLLTIGVFRLPTRQLSAESVVRQVKEAHASTLDRCYRVETNFEFTTFNGDSSAIVTPRRTRLWTRGDRFWIESDIGLRHVNWGRDESGLLWLAFAPRRGLRFEPADVPPAVALRCDILSVRLETLLGDVLTDFDLKTDPARPAVIRALPKPGRRKILREAILEVDPSTKVLNRLELTRNFAGRTITTRFHLEETRELDDSQYQLEGHLETPYLINANDVDTQMRRQILLRLFGLR
jgi:hypothetical protein